MMLAAALLATPSLVINFAGNDGHASVADSSM